jgi:hypothetical protein
VQRQKVKLTLDGEKQVLPDSGQQIPKVSHVFSALLYLCFILLFSLLQLLQLSLRLLKLGLGVGEISFDKINLGHVARE